MLQQNSVDPSLATASLSSQLNFDKRFGWGTLNMGGSRSQDLSSGRIGMVFPRVTLTPSPVNITPSITWSPGFSYTNSQEFHAAGTFLPIVGTAGLIDTLALFAHTRQTAIGFQTPLRIGRWNVDNSITANDATSGQRQEFSIPDSTVPAAGAACCTSPRSPPRSTGRPVSISRSSFPERGRSSPAFRS